MIAWDKCKRYFEWDGSLRDIYVISTNLADWRALYPLLRDYTDVEYSVDNIIAPPPASVEQAFAVHPSGHPMLRFNVGRTLVVFHFFSAEEIECDVDPREITSQEDLDALLGFVSQIGDAIGKSVAITPENYHEQAFITYDPASRKFECHEISF